MDRMVASRVVVCLCMFDSEASVFTKRDNNKYLKLLTTFSTLLFNSLFAAEWRTHTKLSIICNLFSNQYNSNQMAIQPTASQPGTDDVKSESKEICLQ